MRSSHGRWLAVSWTLALALGGTPDRPAAAPGAATAPDLVAPGTASPAPSRGGGSSTALPDTILAAVGSSRRISAADFRRSWAQVSPPARSDTLTPKTAREFLRLLVDKEVLAEAALRESWVWTHAESARYLSARDRMVMRAALERPMAEARATLARAGAGDPDPEIVGIVARDSAVARLGAVYDQPLLERLARAFAALPKPHPDSGMFARLRALSRNPEVDPRDSLAVVARTRAGDYRVLDLLEWWKNLSPIARPRVETAVQMRDLVKNALFERELRKAAAAAGIENRPEILAELERMREYFAVTHLVDREVYQSLPMDSVTLLRFYDLHPDEYNLPTRVRALRLVLETRAEASRMAVRLRDPVEAESLAAKADRQRLGYTVELMVEGDSLLFTRALRAGPGVVLGPDSVDAGWRVTRVNAVLPPRRRSFEEARKLVEHHWYGVEGERRMVDLIARLRRDTRVQLNDRAIARIAAS